jgi:uncharacterized protein (TIGR03118 family)
MPHYHLDNLVANLPSRARHFDSYVQNPWGLAIISGRTPSHLLDSDIEESSQLWVCDHGANVLTQTSLLGHEKSPHSVITDDEPTGLIANPTHGFVVTDTPRAGASELLLCTEGGTIHGYNRLVNANETIECVDRSGDNCSYTGLCICDDKLYVCDFYNQTIDVFDSSFQLLTGYDFEDPTSNHPMPSTYAPFNIMAHEGRLYVSYAEQSHDDPRQLDGSGRGIINVFSSNGTFLKRLISGNHLNAPYGMTIGFDHRLFIGNRGDGKINVYNSHSGKHEYTMKRHVHSGKHGHRHRKECTVRIDCLWSLIHFGHHIYFSAGSDDEVNGLIGNIEKS